MPAPDIRLTAALDAFVDCVGARLWKNHLDAVGRDASSGPRTGKALLQRHAIELTVERLRRPGARAASAAELRIASLAAYAAQVSDRLSAAGRARLRAMLRTGLAGQGTLVPTFHLLRTASLQRSRGFEVGFAGLEDEAPFDLLLHRGGVEAEIACDVISAEEGRGVHRGAWFRLVDRIDPELQTWLAAHPGRYLLKMTLPQGLKIAGGEVPAPAEGAVVEAEAGLDSALAPQDSLALLHGRITKLLSQARRADHDEAAVLRLDPLLLAAAQADELGLIPRLRREFGPEAHLAVTSAGNGVFVMAARAGRENEVAAAVRRRMCAVAPTRLTGTRPGILAMFIEDTDRLEWRGLRERLELEGESRQFLTCPEARSVVAVACSSRLEMFGMPEPDAAPDGEMRFRNPSHPAAKLPALAPAVLSSL